MKGRAAIKIGVPKQPLVAFKYADELMIDAPLYASIKVAYSPISGAELGGWRRSYAAKLLSMTKLEVSHGNC